jgi:protein-tyrosine phosphatase
MDFTDTPGDIEDPWYSGNFETVYAQIVKGCKALLEQI